MGIYPSFGTPPRTQSCKPGSPPSTPGPVQSCGLGRELGTTLAGEAGCFAVGAVRGGGGDGDGDGVGLGELGGG